MQELSDEHSAQIQEHLAQILEAKSETIMEIRNAKAEIKLTKEEIKLAKEEITLAKNESIELTTRVAWKESLLKDANANILRIQGQLSVRGALEFIRAKITHAQQMNIDFKEPLDKTLSRLNQDANFQSKLKKVAAQKQAATQYLGTTMGTIWSNVSKHFHGRDDGVYIRAQHYSKDECLVLVALFEHFSIEYSYFDSTGTKVDFYAGTTI